MMSFGKLSPKSWIGFGKVKLTNMTPITIPLFPFLGNGRCTIKLERFSKPLHFKFF